jgi:hypothetical protein
LPNLHEALGSISSIAKKKKEKEKKNLRKSQKTGCLCLQWSSPEARQHTAWLPPDHHGKENHKENKLDLRRE